MSRRPTPKTVKQLAMTRLASATQISKNPLFLDERGEFLDRFTLCEIVCKAFVEKYKLVKKKDEKGKEILIRLDMRTIPHAFDYFQCGVPKHVQTPVFGAEAKRGRKTCKKIRNGIVHELNGADLQELHDRFEALMGQMDLFLSFFQQ